MQQKILIGNKYCSLTVQKLMKGTKKCECICDCGKTIIVWKTALGKQRSCGCMGKGTTGISNPKRTEMNLAKVQVKLELLPNEFSVEVIASILYKGNKTKAAQWAAWNYHAGHIQKVARGIYKK
ncbi:MAG: hypothetical protein RLZZ184_72 [Cyanobacteriota bacterium]|jgi:hypothetical protein